MPQLRDADDNHEASRCRAAEPGGGHPATRRQLALRRDGECPRRGLHRQSADRVRRLTQPIEPRLAVLAAGDVRRHARVRLIVQLVVEIG